MQSRATTYYHLRSRLEGLRRDIAWGLGVNRGFIKKTGSRVLLYHGICQAHPFQFNTLFITLRSFERQLHFYKKYFNPVSLDDYYQGHFNHEKFNICLTFDDGFANNHKYVLPLLERHKIPAAFFITGIREAGHDILWNDALSIAYKYGPENIVLCEKEYFKRRDGKYISADGKLLVDVLRSTSFENKMKMLQILDPYKNDTEKDYWLQMTEQEIKILSESKWVTIGSHGYYHNDLVKIPLADASNEISRSKKYLERITGKEIKAIAFPYGSYTPEVLSAAKDAGFSQLLATEFHSPGNSKDATMRERLTINPFISGINQMHANITGKY